MYHSHNYCDYYYNIYSHTDKLKYVDAEVYIISVRQANKNLENGSK